MRIFFFFFIYSSTIRISNLTRSRGLNQSASICFSSSSQMMETLIFVGRILVSGVFLLLEQQLKHVFPRTKPTTFLDVLTDVASSPNVSLQTFAVGISQFEPRRRCYARIRELEISLKCFRHVRKLTPLFYCLITILESPRSR